MANSNCVPGLNDSVDGCLYNFGTMSVSPSGTICADDKLDPWVACDVWYVSWGARKDGKHFIRPLPEIYHSAHTQSHFGSDANAWRELSRFSIIEMSDGPMFFVGSLSQRAECGDGCGWGNNYPWEGFSLLSRSLASYSATRMGMRWATDIRTQEDTK